MGMTIAKKDRCEMGLISHRLRAEVQKPKKHKRRDVRRQTNNRQQTRHTKNDKQNQDGKTRLLSYETTAVLLVADRTHNYSTENL